MGANGQQPAQGDRKARPDKGGTPERAERHSGSGSTSALSRLKQWEKSRALLDAKTREKPSP